MINNTPPDNSGAMTTNERVEQLIQHIGTMRSEIHSISKQVDLLKTIERAVLGFMAVGLVIAISACVYFSQV